MRKTKIDVSAAPYKEKAIVIGRRFEHRAQVIIFDYGTLARKYGPGEATLEYKRPVDELPVTVNAKRNEDLNRIYWYIDEYATAHAGRGMVEFTYTTKDAGGQRIVKNTYNTIVLPGVWD